MKWFNCLPNKPGLYLRQLLILRAYCPTIINVVNVDGILKSSDTQSVCGGMVPINRFSTGSLWYGPIIRPQKMRKTVSTKTQRDATIKCKSSTDEFKKRAERCPKPAFEWRGGNEVLR
jgi:hypothetical protein